MSIIRRCPVCWQHVQRTAGWRIVRHRDSIGRDVCPMSGEPYELTEVTSAWAGRPGRHLAVVA